MTLNRSEKVKILERRRGSMPVPIRHQLRRAQAVDEADWPRVSVLEPGAGRRGSWRTESSDSVISSSSDQGSSTYKVVLLGESGVGKTALAGVFGGLQESFPHDLENTEDTYERTILVDQEETTLVLYDIWDQDDASGWVRESCLQMGDAYVVVFSVTNRVSFQKATELRIKLNKYHQNYDVPIILVGNKSDLVRSREVSSEEGSASAMTFSCKYIETSASLQHNTRELFEGVVRQIRLRRDSVEKVEKAGDASGGSSRRRESLTKKAKRFLQSLVVKNNKLFKQRSKSCHDLSVL
ncbi:GTP-binding protein REM 2-like [Latimeria chalumnae]|uniref:GTP-binding protein n=1 Tax=Latimeria chalumnae TaxID=7897 RepID=H3BB02_LATCH|nr:PREDICTED: GTP-binding protein REM 2 isoform X5 [Latimeria chalumnae]XP_005994487.1 PREDICTED: GTP-binding protein REM 2 isoform X5 [Latimeria chalumnae]|eukprot:XP_005994486.1 PREDICTED: GTP-binding protein REM 2 isoform X5 [Latimeria chalumnae]